MTDRARTMVDTHKLLTRELIKDLNEELIVDNPDQSFTHKKAMTSWIRRSAPIGISTNIIFTANARALRHMISQRTSEHAEIEIRGVMSQVAKHCKRAAPNCFQDMSQHVETGAYEFPHYQVHCLACKRTDSAITPGNRCLHCCSEIVDITNIGSGTKV